MPELAVLELACGRCGHVFVRWTADLDVGFDDQDIAVEMTSSVRLSRVRRGEGAWQWDKLVFDCPTPACPSHPNARTDRLTEAGEKVLRHLHDTRTTAVLQTTPDSLLRFSG